MNLRLWLATVLVLGVCGAASARNVVVVLHDSGIVQGDMIGANATSLFLNQDGTSREIPLTEVKEVFDAETNRPLQVGHAFKKKSGSHAAPASKGSGAGTVDHPPVESRPPCSGGEEPAPFAGGPSQGYMELYGYFSMNNAYAIGKPLRDWMNDDVQSGSPAFMNIGGTLFMGMEPENPIYLGVGVSLNIPPSHSIWGSNILWGGNYELVLDPYTLAVSIPVRYAFDEGFSLTLEPALLLTVLSGKYFTSGTLVIDGAPLTGTFYTNMGSIGMGFGVSLGAEYYFGMFGVGAKIGLRMLSSALNFDSVVGPWSPVDSAGNPIDVDLSGSYLTVGVMLKFE